MKMNKSLALIFVFAMVLQHNMVNAQQDAQFTKYMFVPLVFNPAYAGTRDHLAINLLHRSQWVGVNGAPTTQALTLHSPLKNEKVGLGFTALNDAIGANKSLDFNGHYAYHIPFGKSKLSVGVNAGIKNWNFDASKITTQNPGDQPFTSYSAWKPNFGVGLTYTSKYFFAGFSCPHLIEWDLRDNVTTQLNIRQYRHFYGMVGGAIKLNGDALVLRPMAMIKNVGWFSKFNKDAAYQALGAPTSYDLDLSLFFYETLWVGAAYRGAFEQFSKDANNNDVSSHDSFDIWASYFLKNGLRIGAAYDYPLTKIQSSTVGSFEVMLGYEFDFKNKRFATPRYF